MAEQHPEAQSSNMVQAKPTSYGKSPLRVSYKVPFSLRFRYTINSIAHFFRIMQQPPQNYAGAPEFLPVKNGNRVDSYSESLRLLYIKPEASHLARDHWKVVEINTYKDKSSSVKHEYMIAKLSDGDKGEVFLRIDRRLQDSSVKAFGKSLITSGRSSSQPIPQASDSDSGKQDGAQLNEENTRSFKKLAVDEVTIVTPNFHKQKLVEYMVLDAEKRISLPELIVLTCAINNYSTEYHLFEKNCYWFCYAVLGLLRTLSKASTPDPSARGQQGTWRGLRAHKLWDNVDFDMLSTKYRTMWSAFENEIDSIINHPNNKRVIEEKRRADKAEDRMEEAERRAEEEERRAEEEKRRAEEEKRRAEELERQLTELRAQLAQSKAT